MIIMLQFLLLFTLIPVWLMLRQQRSKHEPHYALWMMLSFGFASLVLTLIFSWLLEPVFPQLTQVLDGKNLPSSPLPGLFLSTLVFASLEEIMKFLPAAIYLYNRKFFNQFSDGVIYFGLIGLVFGLVENLLYGAEGGAGIILIRILFGWFFHGALTAIVGYSLVKAKVGVTRIWRVPVALVVVSIMHTIYNFSLAMSYWKPLSFLIAILAALAVNGYFFFILIMSRDYDKKLNIDKSLNLFNKKVSVYSWLGFAMGLIGVIAAIVPVAGFVLPIAAIVLSVFALFIEHKNLPLSISGIVFGITGTAICLYSSFLMIFELFS